ncbi:MAG: proprotein convertase P-domain-containing protein [Bacteroidota bacterium]
MKNNVNYFVKRSVSKVNRLTSTIILFSLFIFSLFSSAQTQLINPNSEGGFELGAGIAANGWTPVQATTNTWRASGVPVPFAGNNAAFISATAGADYVYNTGAFQTSHFYRDVTVPAGENLITLTFQYKNPGENLFDRLLVYTAPTSVFPLANEPQSSLTDIVGATLVYTDPANVFDYTQVSVELPQALAGTTFRLIFTWQNDNVDGSGTPVAIDNIGLTSEVSNFGQPLNGAYTINNLLPTSGAIPNPGSNFNNFNDAINYLNTYGIAGDVRFNVSAGQTFNHGPLTITRTGTAADTIGFIRSGSGANPVIVSSGGTTSTDAGITLNGVDYITIDGIDLAPVPNPGTSAVNIEYALRVNNASATNGSQFNRIRNMVITHNQLYAQNITIIQTTTTAPTSLVGTNSNNTYENITINNALNGIRINSNATNRDELVAVINCQLGTSGPGALGGTSSSYGIYYVNAKDCIIRGNTIANFTSPGGSGGVMDAIYVSNSTGLSEISGNTIRGLRSSSTTVTCVVSGIRCVVASGGSANVYNNFVSDLSTALTTVTGMIILKGLSIQPLTAVPATSVLNVDFNNVSIDGSSCVNVSNACLEVIQTGPTVNIRNNVLANFTTGQSGTPFHYGMVVPNLTIAAAGSISNRNDIFQLDAVNGVLVRKTSATATNYATLPLWNTASGQDAASISVNPEFTNIQSDLHVLSAALDGTGSMNGISWVSVDIDGQFRGATPDIGADEFSLINNDIAFTSFLTPVFDDCFTDQEAVSIRVRNLAYLPHDFFLKPLNIQVNVNGPVVATLNLTLADNNLNGGVPLGSLEYLNIPVGNIDMSAYGNYTISCQLTLAGDQNTGNDLSPDLLLENAAPVTLPVQVPFTAFGGNNLPVAYSGWNESTALQPVSGSSPWTASTSLGTPDNVTASFNYNLGNSASFIVGPKLTAAFNTFVSFDLALTDASSISGSGAFDADDRFSLMVSADCGFNYTEVLAFEFGDLIGNQLTNFEYFLGAYEGQDIILAFKADDGVGNGSAFNLHLDNINLFNSTQEKIALLELVTPVQSACYTDQEEVQVRIRNTGYVPLDFSLLPMQLTATIAGPNSAVLNETISSGSLAIGAEAVYTFTQTADLTAAGAYEFALTAVISPVSGTFEDNLTAWLYGQNPAPVLVYQDTACLLSAVNLAVSGSANGVTSTILPDFQYTSLPVALPDGNSAGIDIPLVVSGSGGFAAQLLAVEIDSVVHPNVTQLRFDLIAPDGSSILLTELNQGAGPGFYSTTFSMAATESILSAAAPFTGTYLPQQAFSNLTGSANGTWYLRVTDAASGSNGILYTWSLTLLEGNTVSNFSWSSGNTIQNSTAGSADVFLENDTYIVYTLTDAMGCSAADSAQIVYPVFSDDPVLLDPLCNGDANGSITANVSGGFGELTYDWSSGGSNPVADQLIPGSYTLDVTDAYGCSAQFIYTLNEPTVLSASGSATDITCSGCLSDITITATGGTAPYTGTGTFNQTAAGTYTYIVEDANGCTASVSVVVEDVTGIAELNSESIAVYPNPFKNLFVLDVDPSKLAQIQLFDAHSREQQLNLETGEKNTVVRIYHLSTGVYFVHVTFVDGSKAVVRMQALD